MMKTNTLDFDAQALREKILDLAMRGKLVPQDPDDEPASVSLEKIKAEKEELIKTKKIKKSKPLPEITDDEKPFEIPNSWEWVRLGDCVFNYDHRRIPISISDRKSLRKIYDYYGASGKIDKVDKFIFSKSLLLISEDGANLVRRTKPIAFIAKGKYWVNNHAHIMDSVDLEILKWISYYINFISLTGYITGSAQPKLTQQNLNKILVPFPPLTEQSRIAAKIAQLFALLRKVESSIQQYANLKDLLKSKLLDLAMRGKLVDQDPNDEPANVLLDKIKAEKSQLVKEKKIKKTKSLPEIADDEKPFEIPNSWEWVRACELSSKIGDGLHGTPKFSEKGYAFINGSNLINDKLQITNSTNYVNGDEYLKYKPKLTSGTVFISLNGTLGKVALYNNEKIVLGKSAGYFNLIESSMRGYFMCYLKSVLFKNFYNKKYTGSVIKNIPLKALRKAPVPLPPLSEQRRIVSKLEQLLTLIG